MLPVQWLTNHKKMYSYFMVFWTDESSDPLYPHLLIPVPGELFTLIHFSSSITRSRNDFGKAECNEDDLFKNKNETKPMHLRLALSHIPYYFMIQIAKRPFYLNIQIKIHFLLKIHCYLGFVYHHYPARPHLLQ